MTDNAARHVNRGLRILVVDDLGVNRKIRAAVLKNAGYRTSEAANGREALEYAVANPPDLVLADILMPVMDGFEMCREWKAHPILRSIPFVFYSGTYTEPKDQEFAFRLGADAFLTKGSDNHQFLLEVERLLSISRDSPNVPDRFVREAEGFYREHSERVVRKLEDKLHELQRAHEEVAAREAELRVAKRELEQRVTERTAELTAINKELESFAYSVSHDLRGPLRVIDACCYDLLDEHSDGLGNGVDQVQRIRRSSRRMVEIIDNLLELSRMSRVTLERTPVDLSNLARDVSDEILESHRGRRIRFDIEVGVKANADPKLMRTVMENLFDNATKYSSRESFAEISFGRRLQGGRSVYYVSDNGVGFDEADSATLFVPFQRLHTEAEFSGTGIGLATVARIVERHGGEVWAESSPGNGATFFFTLQGN